MTDDLSIVTVPVELTALVVAEDIQVIAAPVWEVQIVSVGTQGPAGRDGVDVPYTMVFDEVSDALAYRGDAAPGTSVTDSVWRIRRITDDGYGNSPVTWAGSADFAHAWADRASLGYA